MTAATLVASSQVARAPRLPVLRGAWRRSEFKVGLLLTLCIVGVAIFGPYVAPHTPTKFTGVPFSHVGIFGTDTLGRDVLTRVLYGGRTVVWMSVAASTLGVGAGAVLGLFAAFMGGKVDALIMRSLDVFMAFPSIVLIMLSVSMLGNSLTLVLVVVAVAWTPSVARVIRGASKEVVAKEYVESARLMGYSRSSIVFGEVLPNITTPLFVEYGLRVSWSVSLVASASFLGLGAQPPTADWGLMISENRVGLATQPLAVVVPALCVAAFAIGTSLMAEALSLTLAGIADASSSA